MAKNDTFEELKTVLSVNLKKFKKGLDAGIGELGDFAKKAQSKVKKAGVGKSIGGWLAPIGAFASKATSAVFAVFSVVTSVVGKIAGAVTSLVSTIVRAVAGLVKKITKFLFSILSTATRIFGKIGLIAGGAFAAATGAAVKFAADFEKSMAEVRTISDFTQGEFEGIKESVSDMAVTMGRGASDLARGLYQTISAGATGAADATRVLDVATRAAIAGQAGMQTSVKAILGSLNAYGRDLSDAKQVSDVFFEGIRLGVFRFEELAQAMGPVQAFAAQMEIPLETITAAFATLTKGGVPIERAATGLRSLFAQLLKPSKQQLDAAEALGIDFSAEALREKGLIQFLEELTEATGGSSEKLTELFPNVRALTALLPLAGAQSEQFASILKQIENSSGATNRAFNIMMDTFSKRWSRTWQAIRKVWRQYGEPIMDTLSEALAGLPEQIEELAPAAQKAGRLVAKGIQVGIDRVRDLWEWATERDWSQAWPQIVAGLDQAKGELAGLGDLIFQRTGQGIEPGPLVDVLIHAGQIVFSWAIKKLQEFWPYISEGLKRVLGEVMSLIGKAIAPALREGGWLARQFAPAFEAMAKAGDRMSVPASKLKENLDASRDNLAEVARRLDHAREALSRTEERHAEAVRTPSMFESTQAQQEAIRAAKQRASGLRDWIKTLQATASQAQDNIADLRERLKGREVMPGLSLEPQAKSLREALDGVSEILSQFAEGAQKAGGTITNIPEKQQGQRAPLGPGLQRIKREGDLRLQSPGLAGAVQRVRERAATNMRAFAGQMSRASEAISRVLSKAQRLIAAGQPGAGTRVGTRAVQMAAIVSNLSNQIGADKAIRQKEVAQLQRTVDTLQSRAAQTPEVNVTIKGNVVGNKQFAEQLAGMIQRKFQLTGINPVGDRR